MGSDGRNEGSSEKWWRITPAGSNGTECSIKYRGCGEYQGVDGSLGERRFLRWI